MRVTHIYIVRYTSHVWLNSVGVSGGMARDEARELDRKQTKKKCYMFPVGKVKADVTCFSEFLLVCTIMLVDSHRICSKMVLLLLSPSPLSLLPV